MSTAQIIYEQYKVLPKRIQKELKALIIKEDNQCFQFFLDALGKNFVLFINNLCGAHGLSVLVKQRYR